MVGVEKGGIDRAALCHDERLGENLQSGNQAHDEVKEDVGREEWERNIAKPLPGVGAIKRRRFIVGCTDAFQSRQPNNHSAAGGPKSHQNQRKLACVLVLQPIRSMNTESSQNIVK